MSQSDSCSQCRHKFAAPRDRSACSACSSPTVTPSVQDVIGVFACCCRTHALTVFMHSDKVSQPSGAVDPGSHMILLSCRTLAGPYWQLEATARGGCEIARHALAVKSSNGRSNDNPGSVGCFAGCFQSTNNTQHQGMSLGAGGTRYIALHAWPRTHNSATSIMHYAACQRKQGVVFRPGAWFLDPH